MPFGFDLYPKTKEEYLADVASILQDEETLVVLDTNVLAYLYKLHEAARSEFYSWVQPLIATGRLKIPAWVLSEYLAKLKDGRLIDYTAGSKEPEEIKKKLENLHRIAGMFVDEAVLKRIGLPNDRQKFLSDFRAAINALSVFTGAFKHQFDAGTIHQEIGKLFSSAVLSSDIAELCVRAGEVGEMRTSHRMPPGFRDAGKGDNKYGDIIIWFELLDYVGNNREKFKKTVFLSNDEKTDWVYTPTQRMQVANGKRIRISNGKDPIKLADPRLVAEFYSKVGSREVHIITLPIFIEALSKVIPSEVQNLASAIQVDLAESITTAETTELTPVETTADQATEIERSAPPPLSTVEKTEVRPSEAPTEKPQSEDKGRVRLTYREDALRDSAYEIVESSEIDAVIHDLQSHNWYTQNPAIERLKVLRHREDFRPESWFVLGRNIYQAACGNAQKAMEFIKNLDIELERHAPDAANHILSGMLFEVYFNRDGAFRSVPNANRIDQLFAEVAKPNYSAVKEFIHEKLSPYQARIFVMPGDTDIIQLKIQVRKEQGEDDEVLWKLESVLFDGRELTYERNTKNVLALSIWNFDHHKNRTANDMKSRLAKRHAVPESLISVEVIPEEAAHASFVIPEDKVINLD